MAKRNLDYEIPELLSNLKADVSLYEYSMLPGDLVDALEGIHTILTKLANRPDDGGK